MSSVYNTEPPTKGKVVLKTTHGDLDVELWPREAPLASRNFVQLALEGRYDGAPFHRVVPGLAIQTGRLPGGAAATIYGAPFKDEFHSRLRFTHRGLVACAGGANANDAEFFITTAPAPTPHLDRQHTIFGRVAGATIHTVAAVAGVEVDDADVPVGDPPRILAADVLWNPFDDMVPRSTRAERDAARDAAAAAAKKAAADAAKAAAVKKPQLLSFGSGGDEDEDEDEGDGGPFAAVPRRGMVSAHDAAAGGKLAAATDADAVEAVAAARARAVAAAEAKEADAGDAAAFAARMAARVTGKRGRAGEEEGVAVAAPPPPPPPPPPPDDDRPTNNKRKQASPPPANTTTTTTSATALSAWHARRAAFAGRRGGAAAGKAAKKARDADTLDRLTSFTAALRKGKEETAKQEEKKKDAAAPAATTTPALYSGEIRPDADADLPVAWRVAAYLDGGSKEAGGAAADPTLADLATHRMVAPKPTGTGSAAAALAAGDGLETIDPLADGRAARGEEGGRRGGGGERRGRESRGGGHRRR